MTNAEAPDNIVEIRRAKAKAEKYAKLEAFVDDNLLTRRQVREIPPPAFIVDGWLVAATLANAFGPPGVGKSAVVLDLSCHVATGMAWDGHRVTKGRVVYMAGEGLSGMDQRISAWEAQNYQGREVSDLYVFREALPLVESDQTDALFVTLQRLRPRLIVVDTVARYSSGLEENSASDMGKFIAFLTELATATGACVLLVHHSARGTDHARGSNSLEGAVETEIHITRDKSADATKPGKIRLTKQKNGPDGITRPYTLVDAHGSVIVKVGDQVPRIVDGGDPFKRPRNLVTARSAQHVQMAWVLWSTWRGTSGATRAELRAAIQADEELRFPPTRLVKAFSHAWTRLERDEFLENTSGQRYVLSAKGIEELGFTDELLTYAEELRGRQGQEADS